MHRLFQLSIVGTAILAFTNGKCVEVIFDAMLSQLLVALEDLSVAFRMRTSRWMGGFVVLL